MVSPRTLIPVPPRPGCEQGIRRLRGILAPSPPLGRTSPVAKEPRDVPHLVIVLGRDVVPGDDDGAIEACGIDVAIHGHARLALSGPGGFRLPPTIAGELRAGRRAKASRLAFEEVLVLAVAERGDIEDGPSERPPMETTRNGTGDSRKGRCVAHGGKYTQVRCGMRASPGSALVQHSFAWRWGVSRSVRYDGTTRRRCESRPPSGAWRGSVRREAQPSGSL